MPAGRPKGSLNKSTRAVKEAAQKYTDKALKTLASIMERGESEAARIAAANALLDRGHGKPAQAIVGGDEDDPPVKVARVRLVGPE